MEKELFELIRNIQEEKRKKGQVPATALFIADILPHVRDLTKEVLNKLVKDQKIVWNRTINDDSFRIVKDGK